MKKHQTAVKDPAADLLAEMLEKPIEFEGREMTFREALLRALYRKSLAGDISASIELQDLRESSGLTEGPDQVGFLVVPERGDPEEFARLVYEQQRQFRERPDEGSEV